MNDGIFKITIEGKETCLKFTMLQLERMNELNKTREGSLSFPKVALIYSALETFYRHAKIDCPFSIDEIEVWADNLTATDEGNKLLEEINNAFLESVVFKKFMADVAAFNEQKKTLNGQMLEPSHLENLG